MEGVEEWGKKEDGRSENNLRKKRSRGDQTARATSEIVNRNSTKRR